MDTDCPICYESYASPDLELGVEATSKERLEIDGCDHSFCRECLTTHCKHAISIREIPIRCPAGGSHNCENTIPEDQVKKLLFGKENDPIEDQFDSLASNSSYWQQFQRFLRMLHDPSLVSCTKCDELVSRDTSSSTETAAHPNDLTCDSCGHCFCAVHGDGHLLRSCRDYSPSRGDRKTEKAIRKHTKPCSHCGMAIHKESGCDHIVCTSCKEDFCFKCGSHQYLSGEMMRTCSRCEQSYIDHRYIWRYRMTLLFSLPLYIPVCIVHVILMTVFAVATCGCFCCFGCGVGMRTSTDDQETTPSSRRGKTKFHPIKAIKIVLTMILLPVIDLTQQCGVSCCCVVDLSEIHNSDTAIESDDDDDSLPEEHV